MCTIVVLNRVHPEFPVVVAANRDEFYARPTTGVHQLHDDPRAIGGRDGQKGGTWMGANEAGLFVGLTNQRTWHRADPDRRSRGEVVLEALRQRDTAEVEGYLEGLDPREYNPFNLLYGTAEGLRVAYFRDDLERPVFEGVGPGVHVLPNDRLNAPTFAHKVGRAQALTEPHVEAPWPELTRKLGAMLADSALPPLKSYPTPPPGAMMPRRLAHRLEALCIRTPLYGTRSSVIAALAPGRVAHYLATSGAPDRTPFKSVGGPFNPPMD